MNVIYNFNKLEGLLKSFYTISGVRYSLIDASYNVIFASGGHSEFCHMINAKDEGHARCVECDAKAASTLKSDSGQYVYRCHAGAIEVVLPIVESGQIIAYLFFGQMLAGEESQHDQWQFAKKNLTWFKDYETLETPFYRLARLDKEIIEACTSILKACTSYILLEGIVKSTAQTDTQRLIEYVNENYSSRITLADAASALSMSKTKLCGLAAKQNTTFSRMLHKKRVEAAKNLLRTTVLPVAQIAEMSGVSDYNYFTKLFRMEVGITPREYRKSLSE